MRFGRLLLRRLRRSPLRALPSPGNIIPIRGFCPGYRQPAASPTIAAGKYPNRNCVRCPMTSGRSARPGRSESAPDGLPTANSIGVPATTTTSTSIGSSIRARIRDACLCRCDPRPRRFRSSVRRIDTVGVSRDDPVPATEADCRSHPAKPADLVLRLHAEDARRATLGGDLAAHAALLRHRG